MSSDVSSIHYQDNINSSNFTYDGIYRFEDFRLDASHLMLYENEMPITLAPKVIETLVVLVEKGGEVVSKGEMMNRLWADSFVEESNLTQNIYLLRKTLGNNSAGKPLIETFRRRGYRFTGEIRQTAAEISETAESELTTGKTSLTEKAAQSNDFLPSAVLQASDSSLHKPAEISHTVAESSGASSLAKRSFSRKRGYLAAVAGLLLLTVFGLYEFSTRERTDNLPIDSKPFRMTRLTTNEKTMTATVSPDGKLVAYSVFGNQGQSLWIRQVATQSDLQIVPPEDVLYGGLTFSPDGNHIYCVRANRNDSELGLFRMPAFGGASIKLLSEIDGPVSFAPDGQRFTFVRNTQSIAESYLMVANADGTQETVLATRKSPQFFVRGPAWSPDGKKIICGGKDLSDSRGPISFLEIATDDGSVKQFGKQKFRGGGNFLWLADGSGLVTQAMANSGELLGQLWHVSYPDGEARRITNDLSDYAVGGIGLSADSSLLVAVPRDYTSKIWVISGREPNRATQVTSGKYDGILGLSWTPDGKLIHTTHELLIWSVGQDGTNQKLLTPGENNKRYSTVSPDGRYVVFQSWRENLVGLWRMDIDGSNLKRLTTGIDTVPQVSPDGNWVIFSSARSGKYTLWKVSIDGGEPVQLTDKYTLAPSISPDGQQIACFYWDGQPKSQLKIATLSFDGGEFTKIFEPSFTRFSYPFLLRNTIHWTPDGQALTYIQTLNGVDNIWSLPVADGQPTQLTDFKSDRIFAFDWSRDGRSLACARGTMTADAVLISDFR